MTELSVAEALKTGRFKLKTIPLILFLISLASGLFLMTTKIMHPAFILILSFVFGAIISWLWWSFAIASWKIRAFGSTRNVHELKQKAIRESLMYPDNHWGTKTEIWSAYQKEQWSQILPKFNQKDLPTKDASIPPETAIYFSKSKNGWQVLGAIFIVALGIWLSIQSSYIGLAFIGFGLFNTYKNWKEMSNPDPQIILSEKGIRLVNEELFLWSQIKNEEGCWTGEGKSRYQALLFSTLDEGLEDEEEWWDDHDINLDDFTHTAEEVDHLLRVYRGRYNQKNKH